MLTSKAFRFILLPLVALLLLRLVFWFATFPNPDEAYYWLWGQHPAFSYYDHPPLQAWVQGLFTAVFGRSAFTLRLPNLISNGVFFYTYYQITRYLYGEKDRYSFWLVVTLVLTSPLYYLFLALAWHDHLLITLSLASAYLFIRFLDSYLGDGKGQNWRLYGAAVTIGLAELCKYTAVFVALGFAATVVFDRRLRPLLRDRRIYLAGAIATSAILPILLWNYTNDFQSFRYYFDRSLNTTGFRFQFAEPLKFLLFSVLMLSPVNCWVIFQVLKRRQKVEGSRNEEIVTTTNKNQSLRVPASPRPRVSSTSVYQTVALWVFAISTITLTAISLVYTALYYWNILAYLLLFPLLPTFFIKRRQRAEGRGQKVTKRNDEDLEAPLSTLAIEAQELDFAANKDAGLSPSPDLRRKSLLLTGQFYGLLFAALLVVNYSILPLASLVSKETEADPESRMLFGWKDVAAVVSQQAAQLGDEPLLVTTDYRSASALAYQLQNRHVMAIADRIDQFDFWYNEDHFLSKDILILADDWHPITPELLSRFEQTSAPITVPVTRFGVWIKDYYLVLGIREK
ncbi:MAG: 4-amino-4-deoxy-L-arabinose transferase [Symploca sp. SIO3E6]|nr:4-amino-4-deoxy-L-arabinose transferase [Caldora sp. SIO3E6]